MKTSKQNHLQKSVALTQTDCKQWNINFILQACTMKSPAHCKVHRGCLWMTWQKCTFSLEQKENTCYTFHHSTSSITYLAKSTQLAAELCNHFTSERHHSSRPLNETVRTLRKVKKNKKKNRKNSTKRNILKYYTISGTKLMKILRASKC